MRIVSTLAVLAALCAPAAFAQTAKSTPAPAAGSATMMPVCPGVVVTVRVLEITPGGSAEKFKAAVAAHLAWYRAHGIKNNQIVIATLFDMNTMADSETKFISYHINPPLTQPQHDAAYDAFVKMYADTSKVTEQYNTCMPETVVSNDPVPWMKM